MGARRDNLDDLTPERRAKVEAILARNRTPMARSDEIKDREAITKERKETGRIETTGRSIELESLLELRRFIARLREFREQTGLSLAVVAERSGIDRPALSRLENGSRNPTFATLSRYVRALGLVPKFDYEVAPH